MIIQPAKRRPRTQIPSLRRPRVRLYGLRTEPPPITLTLTLPPASHLGRIYAVVLAADAVLIGLNIALALGARTPSDFLNRQFDLRLEANLAAWYSSALLLLAGVAAWLLGWCGALAEAPAARSRRTRILGWLLIGGMLVALAADEVAQVHEWIGQRIPEHMGMSRSVLGLDAAFRWLLVLAPFIAAGAALIGWVALTCLKGWPRLLTVAGLTCWLGTIAAEYVESVQWRTNTARGMEGPVEEGLEVVGATLLLIAFVESLWRTIAPAAAHARQHPDPGLAAPSPTAP